jgi:hypothetical protein
MHQLLPTCRLRLYMTGIRSKTHITDITAEDWRGRDGPILLQKSFCMINREICWLWVRRSNKYVGGHLIW